MQPRANMYYARGLSAVTGVHKSSIMEPGVANREKAKEPSNGGPLRKVILQNSADPPDADYKVQGGRRPHKRQGDHGLLVMRSKTRSAIFSGARPDLRTARPRLHGRDGCG